MKILALIASILITSNILASEIDSFTIREKVLRQSDPTSRINGEINSYIRQVVTKFNKRYNCSKKPAKKLYKLTDKVRKCLGGHWRWQCGGKITLYRWLKYEQYGAGIEKTLIHPSDSVYRDFKLLKSPSLTLVSVFHNTMGVAYNMKGFVVGSDKFSHFFNRGRKYWKNYYGYGKDAKKITKKYPNDPERASKAREAYMLAMGKYSEESLFGAKSTGVAAYGDLAANFSGMRFWNNFTGQARDIVTGEWVEEPYIKCVGSRFVIKKRVDMAKYVNAAWDEGLNCSVYQTRKMALQVQRRVSELPGGENLHCPVEREQIETAREHYGKYFDDLVKLNPYEGLPKGIKSPKPHHYYDF